MASWPKNGFPWVSIVLISPLHGSRIPKAPHFLGEYGFENHQPPVDVLLHLRAWNLKGSVIHGIS